jgi:hypothetical protein
MDEKFIEKNAASLETTARDELHEANAQGFKFADLLIKVAFAVGGLVAARIVSTGGGEGLFHSKWSLIFLGFSVLCGGVQMMIDRNFFRKRSILLREAADAWKWYASNHEDREAKLEARKSLERLARSTENSLELPTYLQITFVVMGVVFALIDVFSF